MRFRRLVHQPHILFGTGSGRVKAKLAENDGYGAAPLAESVSSAHDVLRPLLDRCFDERLRTTHETVAKIHRQGVEVRTERDAGHAET